MKNLLSRLFYRDAPAQGAMFGLTLATVGSWLWLCIVHVLYVSGIMAFPWLPMLEYAAVPLPITWAVGQLLILLYSFSLLLHFYFQFCRKQYASLCGKYGWIPAIILLPALGGLIVDIRGLLLMLLAVLVWYLPLFLLPKSRLKIWLISTLSWSIGLVAAGFVLYFSQYIFSRLFMASLRDLDSTPGRVTQLLNHPGGWIFFTIGLLGLVFGYLFTAKMLADAEGKKIRQMIGKGTIALWSAFVLSYLVGLVTALGASHSAAKCVADLEQRFGGPLTAEASKQLFYGGVKPDTEFWPETMRQLSALEDTLFTEKYMPLAQLPDTLPDELLKQWRKHWQEKTAGLAELEKRFENPPPLPERQYKTGELAGMLLPELRYYRLLCRLERWQLEFALQNKDVPEIKRVLRRLDIITAASSRETTLIGGLVWIACENIRLDGLERLLESNLLSDADWRNISAELEKAESQVPVIHERALYSEAIFDLDFFEMYKRPKIARNVTVPVQSFRWIFPQLWWQFALDKAELMKKFNVTDFTHMRDVPESPFFMCNMLLPALQNVGYKFYALTARIRSMRALIAADEIRRTRGSFPETLENLPLDPFSGKPLQYRKGDVRREVLHCAQSPDGDNRIFEERLIITAPAVQVWSVGANKLDDDGFSGKQTGNDGHRPDDVRAMIRQKP